MKIDLNEMITGLFENIERARAEKVTAGSKFRLMGLVADVTEINETLAREVLEVVKHEAVLEADTMIDYSELSERVLEMELTTTREDLLENTQLVNDALGMLSSTLGQIADQLVRHHSNEEYARLYEQEKRRYLGSKTAKSARKTFDEWKEDQCYGMPSLEDIDDYLLEKLLHMFEKGVFNARVEHIQRTTRYPGEFDFEQLDDDHQLKKTVYKHYAALRKMVDYVDGCLVVNAARVGQHFYASRHEEKAKANRTNFLKYMYKISLAQEERRKLLGAGTIQMGGNESSLLPDVLATGMAIKYWKRLRQAGFVGERYQLSPTTSRKQAMYIADVFSDKMQMRSKWKPFQELWHINNLAQEKWEMQETGKSPVRSEEIDKIFED